MTEGMEGRREGPDWANEERRPRPHMDGEVAPATCHNGDPGRWTAGEIRLTLTAPPSHSRGCEPVNMESVDTQQHREALLEAASPGWTLRVKTTRHGTTGTDILEKREPDSGAIHTCVRTI